MRKKLNDTNSFNNSIINIKELTAYFNYKNHKSKKKFKKQKMLTTIIKSFDTFVIIVTTSSSLTLSLTGIGLLVIRISTSIACWLTIGIKVNYEIVMQKYILNLSIIYIEKVYKIICLIKMDIYFYLIILLKTWMK